MRKIILLLFILGAGVFIYTSCTKNKFEKPADTVTPVVTCDTASVAMSYSVHVKPILVNNCGTNGCHDAVNKFGGWDLSACTPTLGNGVRAAALSGQLLGAIVQDGSVNQPMPIGGKLKACEIAKIRTWIRQGSLDN